MNKLLAAVVLAGLCAAPQAFANQVKILHAKFQQSGGNWYVSVTLRHHDTGWDHYADEWRIVGPDGKEIAKRVLLHPHENEQPFTRSLGGVEIPSGDNVVYIEAHDKVHGWSPQRLKVDLRQTRGEGFEVSR